MKAPKKAGVERHGRETMANVYYVYLNTMVFTIVAGVVSLILLLALIYVPNVAKYGPLILTVQLGLIVIIVQALVRIWRQNSRLAEYRDVDGNNTMAVGMCPDYMVAGNTDDEKGGGITCYNFYDGKGGTLPIWSGTTDSTDPQAPAQVVLSNLDGMTIAGVCAAVDANPSDDLDGASTKAVPWTELRSRCNTFGM